MRKKLLLSFLVFIIPIISVLAQEVKNKWTLQECVDYAVANNLTVQRSQYNVESSSITRTQSFGAMLPSVNGTLSDGYNWGRSLNQLTYQYTTKRNNSISPNVSSSVTIFNGFRLQNTLRQSNHDLMASEEDLQKTKNDVILNVISLYTNVIFNKELLENAKSQLTSSQQQLERIMKQVAAGSLSRSNELNQEAQVASNELTVITRENSVNLTLLQLKQALQLKASDPLDVVVPDINVEELVIDQSREEVYKIAYEAMPEIKRDNLKVVSSDYGVRAAHGNLYPRLSLNGGLNSLYSSVSDGPHFVSDGGPSTTIYPVIGTVNGTNQPVTSVTQQTIPSGAVVDNYNRHDQLKDFYSKSVSITLSIPILNGLQANTAVQRAIVTNKLAKVTAEQTANTLRQSIETAYNDAFAASKTYASSVKQVNAREEAARMTKQRYEAGAANYTEYQVSENDLFQAKSDLTRAKYDFIFKKKLLDFYQGKPIQY